MDPSDVTVELLREIRDGIQGTNQRLEETREELADLGREVAETREDLGRRITQSEVRTATAIVELAGAVQSVKELLADRLELRDRVERCEQDIAELKRKVGDGG